MNASVDEKQLICAKCKVPMEKIRTKLAYLNHEFSHELLRCPVCGQVYIPEELANGRISEVETMLEDK
ncbi:MAG: hypothetical protein LBL63_04465 [Clostridiales Family XIII bacterium]|nr:hypothetical protein [Clostridiales Family XIII bacterium]